MKPQHVLTAEERENRLRGTSGGLGDDGHFVVRLVAASRPHQKQTADFINEWISWGAGLRGAQYLVLGAKVRALLKGRAHVTLEDIKTLAYPTLRHRILTNYRAEAEGMTVEKIVARLLETIQPGTAPARAK